MCDCVRPSPGECHYRFPVPDVVFVAPYFLPTTARFIDAVARTPGVRLGLIGHDPRDKLGSELNNRLTSHLRVDNALDTAHLVAAVAAIGRELGGVDRLLGPLEELQVPLAVVREQLGIPGIDVETARNFRDKDRMKNVMAQNGLPCARHRLVGTAEGARRFSGVEPDQTVTWTFRRGGSEQTVRVRAIARPFVARAAPAENVVEAYAALERLQVERAQSLAEQADRLRETVDRAAVEARGESSQRELTQLRVELDRMNTTRSAATTEQLNKLREQLSLVERERAGRLTSTGGNQHLRFAGSVGNTEVEVRGLSSVEVSYDNSTGELLIRTVDSTIRVKAPVTNR